MIERGDLLRIHSGDVALALEIPNEHFPVFAGTNHVPLVIRSRGCQKQVLVHMAFVLAELLLHALR